MTNKKIYTSAAKAAEIKRPKDRTEDQAVILERLERDEAQ